MVRYPQSSDPPPVESVIALRAYTIPVAQSWEDPDPQAEQDRAEVAAQPWIWPDAEVVFDSECRVDETQRLTFAWYQIRRHRQLWREGPIRADDLSGPENEAIDDYLATHRADDGRPLYPLTRQEFADYLLWGYAYQTWALLTGFNLAFDLSRMAIGRLQDQR